MTDAGGSSSAHGPGSEAVSVEFTLTLEEFTSAQRQIMMRSVLIAIASGIMLAIVVGGVITASGYAIAVGVIWFVLIAAMFYRGPRAAWRRNPAVQSVQHHTFDDQGATLSFLGRKSEVGWDYFTRAQRGAEVYQLLHGRRFGLVVPRRAFTSVHDEEVFQGLLKRHILVRRGAREAAGQ
jgi:hypothetical protein